MLLASIGGTRFVVGASRTVAGLEARGTRHLTTCLHVGEGMVSGAPARRSAAMHARPSTNRWRASPAVPRVLPPGPAIFNCPGDAVTAPPHSHKHGPAGAKPTLHPILSSQLHASRGFAPPGPRLYRAELAPAPFGPTSRLSPSLPPGYPRPRPTAQTRHSE